MPPVSKNCAEATEDKHGRNMQNYHYEDLILLHEMYSQRHLENPAVIVDVNHSNSNKQCLEQIRICKEVMHSRRHSADIGRMVKGLMIESYIEDGCQKVDGGVYGKSITDPCLGWDKTERLVLDLADLWVPASDGKRASVLSSIWRICCKCLFIGGQRLQLLMI